MSNKEDLQLLIQPYMDAIDKLSQILRVRDAQLSQAQASLAVACEALKRIEAYEAAREIMCKALLKVKWGEDCTACSCSCSNTATKALEDSDKALAEDDAAKSSETKEKK